MGILPPNVHRIIDYLAIVVFALAPTLFHLTANTRMLAYGLAVIHLAITLATYFPASVRRPVPYNVHGIIELVVGIALLCIPFIRHWTFGARQFFPAMGVALIIIWALTSYRDSSVPAAAPPPLA